MGIHTEFSCGWVVRGFGFFLPKKQWIYDYFYEFASEALNIVIFENFVKSMKSCLLKLKVTPSFGFAFKIPDDPTTTIKYHICLTFPSSSL